MDVVRYKPGEAIRWLEVGAEDLRKLARSRSRRVVASVGRRDFSTDLKDAAGALFGFGKSAWADILHKQAEASEFALYDDKFEVIRPSTKRTVRYSDVVAMKLKNDKLSVQLRSGSISIRPHAYVVSGRIKVPIGWTRNEIEVPYETLLNELSARCGVNIETL